MFSKSLFVTALSLLVSAAAFAETPSREDMQRDLFTDQARDMILVNVNGEIITLSDLRREMARYVPELRRSATTRQEFQEKFNNLQTGTMETLVNAILLSSAFDDSGGMMNENILEQQINDTIERDFDGDRAKYLKTLRRMGSNPLADKRKRREMIKAESWNDHLTRSVLSTISPAKVKAAYEARINEFRSEESVEYAQIVLFAGASETEEQVESFAGRLQKQLQSGESNFEETAKIFSRDDFRANGGYVGWKQLAELSEQIAPALKNMKNGAVSDVIALDTPVGKVFVLLKRIAFRETGITPLKDVRGHIENQLRAERVQLMRLEKMAELRDNYHIQLF